MPTQVDVGCCRSCRARIVWATTDNGKTMPVNPEPDERGNLALHRDSSGILHARVIRDSAPIRPWEKRGISHFATCPDAPRHRRS